MVTRWKITVSRFIRLHSRSHTMLLISVLLLYSTNECAKHVTRFIQRKIDGIPSLRLTLDSMKERALAIAPAAA